MSRVSEYMHMFKELPWDYAALTRFSNAQGCRGRLAEIQNSEEVNDLIDQLFHRIVSIASTSLTKRQKQIFDLRYIEGLTQVEISKKIKCAQSIVSKTLNGNPVKLNTPTGKKRLVFGGIHKKMRKLIDQDQISQDLWAKIKEAKLAQLEIL